jgi:SAM-dependent methyltransferase
MTRVASGMRWQDKAMGGGFMDEKHPHRRSGAGWNDNRFVGLSDLLLLSQGASVLDVGCNRGHVAYEFYRNGARLVHGCDIHGPSIQNAKIWFSELEECETKFEVVNLEEGPQAIDKAFGPEGYDIVLFLGTYHKLKRVMKTEKLNEVLRDLGKRAIKYFAWTGYSDDMDSVDEVLQTCDLEAVHMSELAMNDRVAAVWKRLHGSR